jgi:hypothetical protein
VRERGRGRGGELTFSGVITCAGGGKKGGDVEAFLPIIKINKIIYISYYYYFLIYILFFYISIFLILIPACAIWKAA